MTSTHTPFPAGTFRADPERASVPAMVWAQAVIESKLFLRHGEQQLLSVIIPIALLLGISKVNVFDLDDPIALAVPITFAIAALSSGFTGQAIAVAFDRRYGALKRIGASGVPAWAIIVGKICAVVVVTIVQVVLIGGTALLLGWQTTGIGVAYAALMLVIGLCVTTSLGMLLGGTLSSEAVLALANLIWFILIGIAGFSMLDPDAAGLLNAVPSVALAIGLDRAFSGTFPLAQALILALWAVAAMWAANRWFKFHD
ncbi:ABC transporter permease [Corynebacterium sp. 11A]|uniref:ABC transporter permease n=1 Tax=Corynebacterium sp. 11A TaxID=2080510 RepID=UPI001CEF93A7|nr:ABC transporter permease [Corynebacterium sp. 11A]